MEEIDLVIEELTRRLKVEDEELPICETKLKLYLKR